MTTTLSRPTPQFPAPTQHRSRGRRRRIVLGLLLALALLATLTAVLVGRWLSHDDARRDYLGTGAWPVNGQAALQVEGHAPELSPGQKVAPIASLAKVMTAYLVLRAFPLDAGDDGFTLAVTAEDVARTDRERREDQSVVEVTAGEQLTERQALMAVLLPSANNVAEFLARRVAGSTALFVVAMNRAAAALGLRHTRYADPSGFDPRTVSTAGDQLRLAAVVATNRTFTQMVATTSFRLPTGRVRNTNVLLGHDGFLGTKTGSHDAAGGCFMFRARRVVDGHTVDVLGVVLGQPGSDLVLTGQYAARQLLDARFGPASGSAAPGQATR